MQWDLHTESAILKPGAEIEFYQFPTQGLPKNIPKAGDSIHIEFPNDERVSGRILSTKNTLVEVEIDNFFWTLKLVKESVPGHNGKLSNYYKIQ